MLQKLLLILCVSMFIGCNNYKETYDGKMVILTSFYPMYLFTVNVAKNLEHVMVVNLVSQAAGDLHGYQLSPRDMKKIEGASVLVINSYLHEPFVMQIRRAYPNLKIIDASQGIVPRVEETEEEHLAHEQGENLHYHEGINTHFWMSPDLAIIEVKNISEQLSTMDPANAIEYMRNAAAYMSKLKQLYTDMQKMLAPFRGRGVVTYHNAFDYLLDGLGLKLVGTLQLEPGVNPTPKQLHFLESLLEENPRTPIFGEPQYPIALAENLARETGSRVYSLNPITNGPMAPEAYEAIMKKNAVTLVTALNSE